MTFYLQGTLIPFNVPVHRNRWHFTKSTTLGPIIKYPRKISVNMDHISRLRCGYVHSIWKANHGWCAILAMNDGARGILTSMKEGQMWGMSVGHGDGYVDEGAFAVNQISAIQKQAEKGQDRAYESYPLGHVAVTMEPGFGSLTALKHIPQPETPEQRIIKGLKVQGFTANQILKVFAAMAKAEERDELVWELVRYYNSRDAVDHVTGDQLRDVITAAVETLRDFKIPESQIVDLVRQAFDRQAANDALVDDWDPEDYAWGFKVVASKLWATRPKQIAAALATFRKRVGLPPNQPYGSTYKPLASIGRR